MHLISASVVLCVFLGQQVCSHPYKNFNKLYDAQWLCDYVCTGSGGKADFDRENKICKCAPDTHMDGIDQEILRKNAEVISVPLVVVNSSEKRLTKREVDATVQEEEEPIVGQRAPQNLLTPRPRPTIRSSTTSRRPSVRTTTQRANSLPARRITSSIKPMNAQQRLQQLQDQINERKKNRSKSGNRPGPRLQQRAEFQKEATPNIMQRIQQIQKELQEKRRTKATTSITGMSTGSKTVTTGNNEASSAVAANHVENGDISSKKSIKEVGAANEKKTYELITQDPSLYEDRK